MRLADALRELVRSGTGRSGMGLLALLLAISLYVLASYPLDFGRSLWSNPAAWADNPKAVPPSWTNLWRRQPLAAHRTFETRHPTEVSSVADGEVHIFRFSFRHPYSEPPSFLALTLGEVTFSERPPVISVSLIRPDGRVVRLLRHVPRAPRADERPPVLRYHESPLRVNLSTDPGAVAAVAEFLGSEFDLNLSDPEIRGQMERILFGTPPGRASGQEVSSFEPLIGRYELLVEASFRQAGDSVNLVRFVAGGSAFGLMGTDAVGRDLAQGLLFGLPVALFIGFTTSILSTGIGALLGILGGYSGGHTDLVIQRLADIVANIPLLPLLILLVFVAGPNLLLTLVILVAFSWPGLTIQIRAMVLRTRTDQLIEAIESLGASRSRVMFRHILPQVAPYVLAQLIFFAPAAILAEAGLSFLGLGDPSIPTWGQILEQGFRTGGVYVGYWWWVIPPGLLIVVTALAFMLVSLGLEPVVNPRLRTER